MVCKQCGKDNRPEAKYCRFCGERLEEKASSQKGLIGKDNIVPKLEELDRKLIVAQRFASNGTKIGMDCIILGDSGTGKNFIADIISRKMMDAGIAKLPPKKVDAADWGDFCKEFDKNVAALKDGILLITNAQKLLPTDKASNANQLDKLFTRMRGTEGAPIVVLCGLMNEMSKFLENNKDVARLFELEFNLTAFCTPDLTELTLSILKETYKLDASEELPDILASHFQWFMRQPDLSHLNGHLAEKVAENLSVKAALRGRNTVTEEDIPAGERFTPKSEEEILAELNNYIGLQSVKDKIREIVRNVKTRKNNGVKANSLLTDHYLFTGNPGTGKTTFARKFGEVLGAIGALPTGQFVEVSAKDFIGQVVGDTEANVKKYVNKAIGGVLFIDEAYALTQGSSAGDGSGSFGMDAINTLLTLLENRRGEFVCIMAGYTKEMNEFVRKNPGIPSRCNVTIEFPDYNARELEQVFRMLLRRNDEKVEYALDATAEEMLPKVFDRMYARRIDTFGNARAVRNLFSEAVGRHNARGSEDNVLSYADIVGEEMTGEISVEDIMKELDGLVGMKSVKDAIRRIANEMAVQKRLIELGESAEGLTKFNFVLTGNPGTGKTTVARLLGKIFKAMGILSTDRVVEKTPKAILSQYQNQSAQNMNDAITEAMGGVLFLDEAYDIDPKDAAGQSVSREGNEAIAALLTRMENEAGKFVVVCAGYPKQMEEFMNSNAGLKSRFSHFIHIDDYTAEELLEIFERAAKGKSYNFTLANDEVRARVLRMFQNMVAMKDAKFGNAREAMKKLAETKTNIYNRIKALPQDQWTPENIHSVFLEDVPYEEPKKISVDECLEELNKLIGLEGVKSSLTKLAHTINNEIESAKLENRRPEIPLGHYLFLGNPGTGKTTVARLMGKILYSMGALPSPYVKEVGKADLVGRFVGDTEAITSHVIDSAMGGILFIDEAYQLMTDQFGQAALETLLTRLENDRGKFVCIAAGYSHEMQAFINGNSGIPSRFPQRNWITFEDYNPEELYQIFMIYARKGGYSLDSMAETAVQAKFTMMYNGRGRTFGNGREARNLFDEVKSNLAARLADDGQTHTPEERKTIMMEDVI